MSDSISRKVAISAIEEYADRLQMVNWKENPNVPYKIHSLNWCINTIRALPSAEPEIIRCKDCKYRYIDEKFGPSCELDTGDPYATGRNADEDNWFCADAERRTDE